MPFRAWPPFSPVCPPGPDSPLRGEAVPVPRSCRQQQPVTPLLFSSGLPFAPGVCPRSLRAASWGHVSPFRASLGPATPPFQPRPPARGRPTRAPLGSTRRRGNKRSLCARRGADGERPRLRGSPSHRGSLRLLPAGATAPGPPGPLPGAPRERVTVPFCD